MELGFGELVIVLAIFMVLFGAKKLPELGKGLGEAIRGFREGLRDDAAPAAKAPEADPKALGPAAEPRGVAPAARPAAPDRTARS